MNADYVKKFINYVSNAGGSVLRDRFIEDWEPIGASVVADLVAEGMLILEDGKFYLPPSEATAELSNLKVTKHRGYSA